MTDAERNAMVEANTGLVVAIINTYFPENRHPRTAGMEFEDMFQVGVMGLMKGIEKYDASKGFALSTYACRWIRAFIQRHRGSVCGGVSMPAHGAAIAGVLRTADAKLTVALRRVPTVEERVDAIGRTKWTTRVVAFAIAKIMDLEWTQTNMRTEIADPRAHAIEDADDAESVRFATAGLPERTRRAIEMRYGIDGKGEHTLVEVGSEIGCTRERVRQILLKGESEMRRKLEAA